MDDNDRGTSTDGVSRVRDDHRRELVLQLRMYTDKAMHWCVKYDVQQMMSKRKALALRSFTV